MPQKPYPTSRSGGVALTVTVGAALIAGETMGTAGGNTMPELLDGFGQRFHLSNAAAGAIAAAQLLATAVVALLLSRRAARPGRAPMARWGLVAAVAGLGAALLVHDAASLLGAVVLAGAGLGAVFAAAIAATHDSERASAVAVFGGTVVLALLLLAIPQANAAWGGAAGFAVVAVCCVPAWWLVGALPEGVESYQERGAGARPPWWLLAGVALLAATDQGAWSYADVLGRSQAGLSAGAVSAVLSVSGLAGLAGVPVVAAVVRRLGRVRALVVVVVLEAVAKALFAACPSVGVFVVATLLWWACYLGLMVQTLGIVTAADDTGRWAAATAGALAIGTGVGPALVGWLLDAAGPTVLGPALAAATVLAASALVRAARGLPATVRDLARLGLLMARGGVLDGRRIVPETWVERSRGAGLPHLEVGALGPQFATFYGYANHWWTLGGGRRAFTGVGIHGQYLWVDPQADVVVVKTSAWPTADDPERDAETVAALTALTAHLSAPEECC